MTVFAICNHKGGTGKTTTAMHIAGALGLSGRRTLVIDLDPQGFLTRALGIENPAERESVLALFDHKIDPSTIPVQSLSSFDLLPSSEALTRKMRELNKPTDVLWMKESLEKGLGDSYDVVIFDTAAAVTVYSLNALVASRHVLIPVLPEYQSVVGAEQTYQTVSMVRNRLNPRLQPALFLFTQVDARKGIHKTYRSYLREKYGDQVLDSIVRTSTALSETEKDGTTLFDHNPRARGARDYANVTDELIQRLRSSEDRSSSSTSSPSKAGSPPTPQEAMNS